MAAGPLGTATLSGLAGGAVAAGVLLAPALATPPGDGRLAGLAAVLATLATVQMGTAAAARARPAAGFGARLGHGSLIATLVALLAGGGLYWLYGWLRPGLLGARYALAGARLRASGLAAERLARGLAELDGRAVQYLDPAFQACVGAGTLWFSGLLLAAFIAYRWRVAERLGRRAAPRR